MPSIQRPRLIWDEDCEFCRVWITYWRTLTGDSIEYTPYQQAAADYPHIPLKDFQASVHLMSADGTHTTGAHAVFSSLSCRKQLRWLLALELPFYRLRSGDLRGLSQSVSCGQTIVGEGAFAVSMLCDLEAGLARNGAAFYRRAHWEAGAIGQLLYLESESDGLRGTGIGCFYDEDTHRALGLPQSSAWRTLYHFTVGGPVEDARLRTVEPYGHLG